MEILFPSWLLLSILFFTSIYILGYWVIFTRWWPRSTGTAEHYKAASCCMSIVHGTSTSLLAILYIFCMDKSLLAASLHEGHPKQAMSWFNSHLGAPNTPFQEALMEYSIAYFLIDLLHYILFVPNQPLFVLHHIFTLFYMLSCRFYTKHGAFSTIVLFAVAECTSFLQNLWSFATITDNKPLFNALNVPFLAMFTAVRGLVMPWATWKLCGYYLFSADAAASQVPSWLAVFWMGSVWVGITGSLYWVALHWAKLLESGKASTSKSTVREPPAKAEPIMYAKKYV